MSEITSQEIFKKYDAGYQFNENIGLYDNVEINEDYFIGNQWRGVDAKGLPTPTFNLLKQVVNFDVASITSDNFVLQASPLPSVAEMSTEELERICYVVNRQYAAIIERNRIVSKMRQFLRNAAVDGDGCMYFTFDPTIKNGQKVKGEIVAELAENTRVIFGNPSKADVQKQPYIIIVRRDQVEEVRRKAKKGKESGTCDIEDIDGIHPDTEVFQNSKNALTDDKVTVLMYFWKDPESGTVHYAEAIDGGFLRKPDDTGYHLYPLVWLNWDFVHDCYHGQAMITGLIPNQNFINKMFAMVGVSQMTTAFPKTVFDRTKIKAWNSAIGAAVGVNGNVDGVAKTIQGAAVSPQIAQFIEMCMGMTKSLLGASDVALGDSRPDNTSAIIALQRAANTPMEMTKQNMYQCIEEMGLIWQDMMGTNYGTRTVEQILPMDPAGEQPFGAELGEQVFMKPFDFSILSDIPFAIKHDAGVSSYWSEVASMQTIENLLMQGKISVTQFLERVPSGYIPDKERLINELKGVTPTLTPGGGESALPTGEIPVTGGSGNGALQRSLTQGV